jgi:hypothetical protein
MVFACLFSSPKALAALPQMTCSGTTGSISIPLPATGFASRATFSIANCDGPNINSNVLTPWGLFPNVLGYDTWDEVAHYPIGFSSDSPTSSSSYQTVTGANGGQYGVYWDDTSASDYDGYFIYVISPPTSGTSDTLTLTYVTASNACLNSIGTPGTPCDPFGNPLTDGRVTINIGTITPTPPVVTSISPVTGPTSGGTSVMIAGTNLTGATAVKFGATVATGVVVNSATSITAASPAGSAGTVDITVTTSGGTSVTGAGDQFTYVATPTVSSVSPVSGPTGGGTAVIIAGTGFAAANATGAVKFGGTNATYTINSNTQITATAPARSAGTVDVTVTTSGGTSTTSAADHFTYAVPTATQSIASIALTQNHATTSFIPVTGSGGIGTLTYSISPALPLGLSFSNTSGAVSGTSTVTSTAGTYTVTVTDANNATATNTFTLTVNGAVTATQAVPTTTLIQSQVATSFIPVTGSGGTGSLSYSVSPALPTGLSMAPNTGAITGTPTVVTSAMPYTVTVADNNNATATASFSLTVDTPLTAGAKSATVAYNSNGSTATAIDLTSSITGGVATNVSVVTAPAHGSATANGLVVTYTPTTGYYGTDSLSYTATGISGTSSSAVVSITVSGPSITVGPVSLANGPVNIAYTQSLSASGGASPYTFSTTIASGSLPAGLILSTTGVISGTPTAAGTYSFTVSGTDSSTGNGPVSFTSSTISLTILSAQPIVTSINPTLGIGTGGTAITINGTSFTAASTVKFGSTPATSVTYLSPTTLTAVAPAGTGTVDVTVTTVGGTSATSAADRFSYIAQVPALMNPLGVAVDGSGNLYVADSGLSYIVKVPTGCASLSCETIAGGGLTGLSGVAVDGNGNIYALSGGTSGTVTKLPWNAATTSYGAQTIVATGLGLPAITPSGVAVDGTGNLYFTDTTNKRIVELPWIGNANVYGTQIVLSTGTGSSAPTGVAVDSAGNLYIADPGSQALMQLQPGGSQTTLATGINAQSVGVDGSGNVYYSDPVANTVMKLSWDGSTFGPPVVMATSLNVPYGIAVDDGGNIFITNNSSKTILKATVTAPPSLSFTSIKIDATSTDSPQIATLANIGNALLSFPPVSGINPALSAGFKLDSSSTCPQVYSTSIAQTLGQGQSCKFAVDFSPTSTNIGANNGTLVATDTDLNASSATQTIPLSGAGIPDDVSSVELALNPVFSVIFGQAVAITATVKDTTTPATIPSGNIGFTSTNSASVTTTINPAVALIGGSATVAGFTPTAVGTYTITGNYTGSVGDIAASSGTISLTVSACAPTLAYTPATTTQTNGTAITAAVLNATATDVNGAAISGTFTYTTMVNSVPKSLVAGSTVLPAGTYTIAATFIPADTTDYVSGRTISASYTVTQSTATVTLGNLAQTYTGTAHSATAVTVPANLNVSFTYNGSSVAPITAGSYTVLATVNDANYNVTATGTLVIAKASPAAVLLSSNINSVLVQNAVLLTATVSSPLSAPSGLVTFLDGNTPLGTVVLSGGMATLSTTALTVGSHNITAAYQGDNNFLSLSSAVVPESVLDYALNAVITGGSNTSVVVPGGTATWQFNISPTGATIFPANVALTASGLPAGATYTITPSTIVAGASATNVTLVIKVPLASASLRQRSLGSGRGVAPFALALLLLPFAGRIRRSTTVLTRIAMALVLVLTGLGGASLFGCGSSNGFLGQQQKSYSIIITGTSGAFTHSTTVQLVVE